MFQLIELQSPHLFTDPLCVGPWFTLQHWLIRLSQRPYPAGAVTSSCPGEQTAAEPPGCWCHSWVWNPGRPHSTFFLHHHESTNPSPSGPGAQFGAGVFTRGHSLGSVLVLEFTPGGVLSPNSILEASSAPRKNTPSVRQSGSPSVRLCLSHVCTHALH